MTEFPKGFKELEKIIFQKDDKLIKMTYAAIIRFVGNPEIHLCGEFGDDPESVNFTKSSVEYHIWEWKDGKIFYVPVYYRDYFRPEKDVHFASYDGTIPIMISVNPETHKQLPAYPSKEELDSDLEKRKPINDLYRLKIV